jgi:RNA polymerase sigma-70 factor (ECF subfamily)
VSTTQGSELLERARAGDEAAFEALVAPWHSRVLTLCYQMMGSVDEAEDVLQDTLIRAWKGIGRFEGKSEVGTWLQAIAARRCLTAIERRRKRALPMDYGPPTAEGEPSGDPLPGDAWIDPFPELSEAETVIEPSARYELRESIELAFIAAIHNLSANQRAVLLLRDVLGFSAKETAEALDTTTGSVTSALQRARRRIEERLPRRSQQATLRALGDERLTDIVERYGDAWEQGDVDAVVALLSEDATFAMPPLTTWFEGTAAIAAWLRAEPLAGNWRWRLVALRANGQAATAFYCWVDAERCFLPFALKIFAFDGERIESATAFIVRIVEGADGEALAALAQEPVDEARKATVFTRLGLPPRLAA